MQAFWRTQKVLRVTESLTGSERFETLNQKVSDESGNIIEIRNNITQGMYDLVVSNAPQTDTVREKNLDLITEWVKKSPPEAIPPLILTAFELSNLPNKEQLIAKIKPMLGGDPSEDGLSPAQLKQKVMAQLEAQQAEQAKIKELQMADAELDLLQKQAEIEETKAKIERLKAEAIKKIADVESTDRRVDNEAAKVEIERSQTMADIAKTAHEITQPVTGNA